jgi:putative glutamine transport system substrate-binding protein
MDLFPDPEATSLPSAYVAPTSERVFPPDMTTASRILARGEMVVGIRYDLEPFSFLDDTRILEGGNVNVAGLEIDLARELARRWLGDAQAVQFRQVRSDTAAQRLHSGEVDFVLAGVVHTQQAEAQADFGPAYFANGQALLTFPATGVRGLDTLYDLNVGLVGWTETEGVLRAHAPQTVTYEVYDNFFQAVEALRTRQVDVYADKRHRLERARRMVADTHIVGQYTWEPFALMYRHNDPFFANLVTLTFQDMAADGTRDALFDQWLPGTSPPSGPNWPGDAATPSLEETPQQLATGDVIARIQQRGAVVMGFFTDRWPYSAVRNDGVPTGFELRLVERLVERWLGSRQAITYTVVTEASEAFRQLNQGEVDILVGDWMHTREAELLVDFSIPVFDDGVSILSNGYAPMENIEALAGYAVGVIAGSVGEAALPEISQRAGVGLSPITYPDLPTALAALQQGEIAAILEKRRPLLDVFYNQPGFFLADPRYTYRPNALVLPQGDSAFRDLVNLTLLFFQESGSYPELYRLWFDDPIPKLETWPGHASIPLVITAPE